MILNSSGFNKLNLQQNFTHLGAPRGAQPHIYEQKSDLFMFQRHGFKHVHVAPRPRGTASCCCCHHGHVCSCCLCCILLLLFCSYFSLPALASSLYIFFSLASDPVQWVHYTSDVWKYHWTVAIFPYTELKKKSRYVFGGRYRRCFGPSLTKLSTDVYLNRKNKPAEGRNGSNLEKSHLLAGALLASSGEYWWVS